MDNRSAYINKLKSELRMVFPQYLNFFPKITVNTALTLLEKYTSPDAFLNASKDEIIASIHSTACFGIAYAEKKHNAIMKAANDAGVFGYSVNSNF